MVKKVIVLVVVGFAVYYLLTAPQGAADAVRGAFDAIMDAFSQVLAFIDRLFS